MGDKNQLSYLKRHLPAVAGPVLEVGSKDYGSTASFRDVYTANEYVGVDMAQGKGVDAVVDLAEGVGALQTSRFGLAICCSVLEHVRRPWVFAQHLTSLVRPGGHLYMSVPWVWRYHAYPDDYFRFSWRGVIELFPEFEWAAIEYSTNVEGEFIEINEQNKHADDQMAQYHRVSLFGKQKRKYLPYLLVNMIGRRSAAASA
jgi:SAM-dependent methyltransferase